MKATTQMKVYFKGGENQKKKFQKKKLSKHEIISKIDELFILHQNEPLNDEKVIINDFVQHDRIMYYGDCDYQKLQTLWRLT